MRWFGGWLRPKTIDDRFRRVAEANGIPTQRRIGDLLYDMDRIRCSVCGHAWLAHTPDRLWVDGPWCHYCDSEDTNHSSAVDAGHTYEGEGGW